ncbi:Hydroperoxy fatty acid reductase gpx1 [Tepidimonas fonticaldi]|uniref:Glutathione peroxidase n=1 Tax=Tepidimonas fonticaldi TaxID=1101373 RepID=A0A554XLZ0_9BURK|nr:glutathione peroxidase [Tepidimonas fonticaldi]TSE36848.1 Hydroperoxy fatty acid reductase gpx1 [Tepidimonas fonticaldi]
MKTRSRLHTLAAAALAVAALAPMNTPSHAAPATPATASCPAILQHRFDRLQDEKPQDLCQYAGQVVLVVNTASYCGFTQQYKGLEELYRRYRDRGLVVLGFPFNDFGQQEPGSNQQIAEFCENTFGVQFPMFAKSHVRGPQANALFRQLAERTGTTPKWNFYKYLISRDGRTVLAYNSLTAPDSGSLRRDIERLLGS